MSQLKSLMLGLVLASSAFAVGCNGSPSPSEESADTSAETAQADDAQTKTAEATVADEGTTEYAAFRGGERREGRFERGPRGERVERGPRGERVRREGRFARERHEREILARREREARERGWFDRVHDWRNRHGF